MKIPSQQKMTSEENFLQRFVANEPALRALGRSILPNWDLVDEALQEASVTMWQKRNQVEGVDGFLPWAKVIVRYKCLQMIDGLRREHCVLSQQTLELIADEVESTDAEEHGLRQAAVRQCLEKFSPAHRELLLASHLRDRSMVDMAQSQGKSPNSLYKLLGRLREKLYQCVSQRLQAEAI